MNIGSIVRLRAGGPHMTVQALLEAKAEEKQDIVLVKCIYIDQNGILTRPIFPQPCLEEVLHPAPTQETPTNG